MASLELFSEFEWQSKMRFKGGLIEHTAVLFQRCKSRARVSTCSRRDEPVTHPESADSIRMGLLNRHVLGARAPMSPE